ncbi:MAG: class I SAM-dependent rRNA methyltransferase [Verrucomicrobiota bacterium]
MSPHPSGSRPGPQRVALRKNLARSVRAGHPWIFRDALRPAGSARDGDVVLVTAGDGRVLGRGFWTSSTPIAVRMLTTDPAAGDIGALVRARLAAALQRRLAFLDRAQTNAFRWVHGEADLLPGLHLDVYDGAASVRFDGPGARAFYRDLAPAVAELGAAIGLRTLVERVPRRREAATPAPGPGGAAFEGGGAVLFGQLPSGEIEVRENGLAFGVDLRHGQKGGLFLDQRDNRARVRGLAGGQSVLNLFGYTGGFSIYAAAGGARDTTTVDSSAGAIASARENFRRNQLPIHSNGDGAGLVVADVFAFLGDAIQKAARWDVVISDPPSFAPSRRAVFEALRAYRRLHRLCAQVVAPGGILCAASCSSHVDAHAFQATIDAGCADAGRRFQARAHHGAGADHPVLPVFPEGRYLKFTEGTVD